MPEPKGTAKPAGEVAPRVYRWTMHDDRIDSQSDSYAVVEDGRIVLIDPLPMAEQDLANLGTVHAIVLTASCHERSAWRYRRQFNVPVHAPSGAVDFEEDPDFWYDQGDHLAGNLIAIHTPGPTEALMNTDWSVKKVWSNEAYRPAFVRVMSQSMPPSGDKEPSASLCT